MGTGLSCSDCGPVQGARSTHAAEPPPPVTGDAARARGKPRTAPSRSRARTGVETQDSTPDGWRSPRPAKSSGPRERSTSMPVQDTYGMAQTELRTANCEPRTANRGTAGLRDCGTAGLRTAASARSAKVTQPPLRRVGLQDPRSCCSGRSASRPRSHSPHRPTHPARSARTGPFRGRARAVQPRRLRRSGTASRLSYLLVGRAGAAATLRLGEDGRRCHRRLRGGCAANADRIRAPPLHPSVSDRRSCRPRRRGPSRRRPAYGRRRTRRRRR